MDRKRPILGNKIYLYLTEFFAGMSVMAVELGASRLLAPYFSSSQIVWTIIIGTIMIAMALGNLYGGRSADRNPNPDRLYGRIIIAAIWIALIPVVGKYIIVAISAFLILSVNSNFLIISGFVTCMVIFVFPLFLLGTVTPSLVKYTMDSLNDSGRTVGNLNAFNTVGSIIGTFVPTFISIPTVGTAITFLVFGGILLTLSLIYFISSHISIKKMKKVPVSFVIFILCCIFGHSDSFAFWNDDLIYEGGSVYNYLQVYEDEYEISLSTNVLFGVQSVYEKQRMMTGAYYDYAMAAPVMAGLPEKGNVSALVLGMGTGTFATQCGRYFTGIDFTGVEIDEKITDLAHKYFHLSEDIPVITYDGRAYLNAIDDKYDVIMVDAYQDITIPFQMSSVEFFTLVRDHLTDDGVMVVNFNMRGNSSVSINEYLSDTIASVFPEVRILDVPTNSNCVLYAMKKNTMMESFTRNAALIDDPELSALFDRVKELVREYKGGNKIMTDDKAPVELLGMKVIDTMISDEVSYYKEIYKKEGLKGLLRALQ